MKDNLTEEQSQCWIDAYGAFIERNKMFYEVGDRVIVDGEIGTVAQIEQIFPSPYQVHFDNGTYGDYPKTELEAVK